MEDSFANRPVRKREAGLVDFVVISFANKLGHGRDMRLCGFVPRD